MKFDQESADYYTLNRYYPANLGRWLSPDPLGGDITNPQSLNRYAYVLNNPTSLADPIGLDAVKIMEPGGGTACEFFPWECGGGGGGGGGPGYVSTPCDPETDPGCRQPPPPCDPFMDPFCWPDPGWGGGGGGGGGGGTPPPPTGNAGGGAGGLPAGVNAFLGFQIICVQSKMGGVVYPATCALYFLNHRLNVFTLGADLSAAGLVIAGSVTAIVPAAYVGGAGPALQLAFSSQGWGCVGGGGAIGSVGKAFNFGPITGGDLGNAQNVLSGWSVSTGWQSVPSVGAQATGNSSGLLYGPAFGTPGWSLSGTYSFCGNAPW